MLICVYSLFILCCTYAIDGQLLRPDLMNLGTFNPDTKKYEKNSNSTVIEEVKLGGDDHDYKPHKKVALGGDDHDYKPHKKVALGGDDHDYKPHKKVALGGDDHDYKPHKKIKFGGDDHDYKPHKKVKLGGDDHDYKPHKKLLLGADDHDYKSHRKVKLGGDDHDYKPHKKLLLGADDHDYKSHRKNYFGGDDHDKKSHKKRLLGRDEHDYKLHKKAILGGDDHDFKPHRKLLLGSDGHDFRKHRKALLGSDGHDYKAHKKHLLGEDNHDYKLHKKHFLGQDEHDFKPHRKVHLHKHAFKHHKSPIGKNFKARPHLEAFQYFIDKFSRLYNTKKEYLKRFQVFRTNMKKIKLLQQNEMGTAKYGITKFTDWTISEFRKLLGVKPELKSSNSHMQPAEIPDIKTPDEFDWRDSNVVTEVKNQGACGSCWAFSVTGNIEGQWALKHKQLYSLSEQELVDCDHEDKGCEGGLPENAYKVIEEDLGGLETETDYPYEGKDDKCVLDTSKIKVKVNGSVELPDDEEKMKRWLVKNGPISIGINANALQFYVGGVSHPYKFLCSPEGLDHGMLIVGYGVHTTRYMHRVQPYWIIKNSWGKDWGEKGYYRVYRGDGTCGVNKMATSAVVP